MLVIDGYGIKISRGDTGSVAVTFEENPPVDGTLVRVTLKKGAGSEKAFWVKDCVVEDGDITFNITSEDSDIPMGKYYYDLRIIDGESVVTPLLPQSFEVLGVIGDAKN